MSARDRILLALALSAAWVGSSRLPVESDYLRLVPVALFVLVAVLALSPAERSSLRPQARTVLVGLLAGAAMVALTYPAFDLLAAELPALGGATEALYARSRWFAPLLELPALVLVVVAEELLWRGLLAGALRESLGAAATIALAAAVYALAQAGLGSGLLVGLAFGCGLVWGGLRFATGSLWAPFGCHLVWTTSVVVIWPLVAAR